MESVISSLILVFVKLHGLRSKPSIMSRRYLQLVIPTSHTFGDLLYLVLEDHKASNFISDSDVSDIIQLGFKVHHQSKSEGGSEIGAGTGASCLGLKMTGNMFVHYEFKEASQLQKHSIMSNQLMKAQNCRVIPDKYDNPSNFAMKVYNFIIDGLVIGDFSVPLGIKDKVAKLCRAIRDALVMLKSRVVKKKLPLRFQYTFERFASRDLTTTSCIDVVKAVLVVSFGECQSILLTQRWSGFYIDVQKLLSLLEQILFQNENKALTAHQQRETVSDGIGDRLKGAITVQPIKRNGCMAPYYLLLRKQLKDAGDWRFVTVTTDQINKWHPPPTANESPALG